MNTKPLILISLFVGLMSLSISSRAYDIDIYSGLSPTASAPNIMVVVDNPSSQNNNMNNCTYFDGTVPSNNGTALGADQCALANLIHAMSTRNGAAITNLGITTMTGVDFPLTPIDDNPYTGLSPVTISSTSVTIPAGSTDRQAIILAIKGLQQQSGKSGQGTEFQETWAYYTGGNGTYGGTNTAFGSLSGRTYPTAAFPLPTATTGCQKNYIIYLSNVKANAGHAQDNGELPYLDAGAHNALALGNYGNPTTTSNAIFKKVDPSAAGYTGLVPNKPEAGYGIEWARFMFDTDINAGSVGVQNIVTYSVGTGDTAVPPTAISNTMEFYISDVAAYGGGKYFAAGTDPAALQSDILKIFNEVQAVNSVFSSSSLPVSVNAQGTFLNQIYMGMFRPDPNGNPRWVGNLKQYQFILNTTTNALQLGDSIGNPAISSAGTGFISANAISFWTCTNLTTSPYPNGYLTATPANVTAAQITTLSQDLQGCPDPLPNGFWANDPASTDAAAMGFDLPDGELVNRGGSAQQIHQSNLTDNYATAPGSATNPRRLYTWCPSGAGCNADMTVAANFFDTSNAAVTDTLLGTGTRTISSITSAATVNPNSPLTGGWTAPFGSGASNPKVSIIALSKSGNTVTATVSAADLATLYVGAQLHVATGATTYDCNPCSITTINTGTNTFTYTNTGGNGTPNLTACPAANPSGCAEQYTNWIEIYSPTPHGLSAGQLVTISGCTTYTALNGVVGSIVGQWLGPTWFVIGVSTPLVFTGFDSSCVYTPNTAYVTTSAAHGFPTGDTDTIAGATPAGYNGTWVITVTGATTFTYQYTVAAPLASFSGAGATAQSFTVTRDSLTKWVRGDDNMGDEASLCPPGATAGTGNCPNPAATMRPSVHGDVLHSRPTVLNYGYHSVAITGTSDSGNTRTATASVADVNTIRASGATPVVTFANSDACAVTIASATTFTYPISVTSPAATCGASGAQTVAVGSKVVVYYGDNNGVFHAINGNRGENIGLAGPGDELWGFIPKEFMGWLGRMMTNSPQVLMPSTPTGIIPAPTPKDYFVDGEPGIYQTVDGNGNTQKAIIYLAMRRGVDTFGRGFIYALDVTTPTAPRFVWKVDPTGITTNSGFTASTDYQELGQTWSQPRVTKVAGYCNTAGAATPAACSGTNPPSPVLIFGAGYDSAEDQDPTLTITKTDASGRGIFVLDALTGAKVWTATFSAGATSYSGTTTKASALVSGMNYSIPAAITLVNRLDPNGFIDRLYAADLGGNIWRVDLEPAAGNTPDQWRVYQLAALGGFTGACGTPPCNPPPRKFFYPPEVISATSNNNYDAVIAGSGDREHPLYQSVGNRLNRIFMLKDTVIGDDASGANPYPITLGGTNPLDDCTGTTANPNTCSTATTGATTPLPYNQLTTAQQNNGYYITLAAGEKVVNAPLVVAGLAYMSTNQPSPPSSTSCNVNLGTAKGYQLSPFSAAFSSIVFSGGGLPPSPVAGIVDIVVNGAVQHMPFVIGAGNPNCVGSDCTSALGGQKPPINVSSARKRTYWYIEGK